MNYHAASDLKYQSTSDVKYQSASDVKYQSTSDVEYHSPSDSRYQCTTDTKYQSVYVMSDQKDECIIATEVSAQKQNNLPGKYIQNDGNVPQHTCKNTLSTDFFLSVSQV